MKFLFIETFFQGSHRHFAEGLAACSSHEIDLLSMPGENYRWRMLGAALHLVDNMPALDKYDGIIVSDLINLSDFKALLGKACPPVLVYFHENQITYPQPPGDKGAFQLGIINITTALAADIVCFNSRFQQDAFAEAVPAFLNRGRDFRPGDISTKIVAKSKVLHPGITLADSTWNQTKKQTNPPLIIWNHRWGYDKNGDLFFDALKVLEKKKLDFRLALMGENFGKIPDVFITAKKRFGPKILQYGFVQERKSYEKWLEKGAIVVSTANQENFGMSVIEAMIMGCLPLLPKRLSYPEILPHEFHDPFLYKNKHDLAEKLSEMVADYDRFRAFQKPLAQKMRSFLWPDVVDEYDRMLERLVKR